MQPFEQHRLAARALEIWRGDRPLCRALDLGARSGELHLITGANGSGKTTLLRCLVQLRRPEAGVVALDDQPVGDDLPGYRAQLAYLGHEAALRAELSLVENLRFHLALRGRRADPELLEVFGLGGRTALPVRALSAGQRRRGALAMLVASDAPLWFLDEPYTSLDEAGEQLLEGAISEHLERGGLVFMASHRRPRALTVHAETRLGERGGRA